MAEHHLFFGGARTALRKKTSGRFCEDPQRFTQPPKFKHRGLLLNKDFGAKTSLGLPGGERLLFLFAVGGMLDSPYGPFGDCDFIAVGAGFDYDKIVLYFDNTP